MEPSSLDPTTRMIVERYFTREGVNPLDEIDWGIRTARAGTFEQEGVEAPTSWSDMAVGITAKLYFATVNGRREWSVRSMIERVAKKITDEGCRHGYFAVDAATTDGHSRLELMWNDDAQIFHDELSYLLVNQMAAFNTPVWLNVGVPGRKQCCSACFLLSVEDTMLGERFGGKGDHSIMDWVATEAAIFKMGAGSGINLSNLRGSMEPLSTGGTASGPTSYMRLGDANAGTLKSGGAHRRAAKMVILNADHPDIRDFIDCKRREDERMRILAEAGVEINPFTASGEKTIAESTSFQNENISVGASDAFMSAAADTLLGTPRAWGLTARTTGETIETVDADLLLGEIAEAAWTCGDPGIVFLDRCNEWHTTPSLGPVTTVNPCSETVLNDDSSCNLASLNLVKFLAKHPAAGDVPAFEGEYFRHAVDVMVTAMDITCSFSELPTEHIERNTRELRQLGLGYSNLGAALMSQGLPYDSEEARDWAASVTALMTGRAYRHSALMAEKMDEYARYGENYEAHRAVIEKHLAAIPPQDYSDGIATVWKCAESDWAEAHALGVEHGYRNSQVTVVAPTGTTSYLMDCDTTGAEPGFSLVSHKGLAGGGSVTLVNKSVWRALLTLGYDGQRADQLVGILENQGEQEFLNGLNECDHKVFQTANGISSRGHMEMVASVQPFLSGAVSKTINLHNSATPEDIKAIYIKAWRSGLKAVSVYRDGSKATQVLTTKKVEAPQARGLLQVSGPHPKLTHKDEVALENLPTPGQGGTPEPARDRLPSERQSITHKFSIGGHEGYITAGMYDDGRLGEFFATGVGKEGSFLQGMMGSWSIACSIAFQQNHGGFATLARKYVGMEFEPKGETGSPDIPYAKSFPDYIFRWLVLRFGDTDLQEELGVLSPEVKQRLTARLDAQFPDHPMAMMQFRSAPATPPISGGMFDPVVNAKAAIEIANGNGFIDRAGSRPCTGCGGLMHRSGTCYTCSSCGENTGCG